MGRFYKTSKPKYDEFVPELPTELLGASLEKTIADKNQTEANIKESQIVLQSLGHRKFDADYLEEMTTNYTERFNNFAERLQENPSEHKEIKKEMQQARLEVQNELQTGGLGKIIKENDSYNAWISELEKIKNKKREKGEWDGFAEQEYAAILALEEEKYKQAGGARGGGRDYGYPSFVGFDFNKEMYEAVKNTPSNTFTKKVSTEGVYGKYDTSTTSTTIGEQRVLKGLYDYLNSPQVYSTVQHYKELGMFGEESDFPIERFIDSKGKEIYKINEKHPLAPSVKFTVNNVKKGTYSSTNKNKQPTSFNPNIEKALTEAINYNYLNVAKVEIDPNNQNNSLIYVPVDITEDGTFLYYACTFAGATSEVYITEDELLAKKVDSVPVTTLPNNAISTLNTLYENIGRELSRDGVRRYMLYQSKLEAGEPATWDGAFIPQEVKFAFGGRVRPYYAFGGKVDIPPSEGSRGIRHILNTSVDEKLGRRQTNSTQSQSNSVQSQSSYKSSSYKPTGVAFSDEKTHVSLKNKNRQDWEKQGEKLAREVINLSEEIEEMKNDPEREYELEVLEQTQFRKNREYENVKNTLENIEYKANFDIPYKRTLDEITVRYPNASKGDIQKIAEKEFNEKISPSLTFQKNLYEAVKTKDPKNLATFYDSNPTYTDPRTGKTIPYGEISFGKLLKNTLEINEEQINRITEALQRAGSEGKLNLSFDEDGDILLNPIELRKLGIAYENFLETRVKRRYLNSHPFPDREDNQELGHNRNTEIENYTGRVDTWDDDDMEAFPKVQGLISNLLGKTNEIENFNLQQIRKRYDDVDLIEKNHSSTRIGLLLKDPRNAEGFYENVAENKVDIISPEKLHQAVFSKLKTEMMNPVTLEHLSKNISFLPIAENNYKIQDAGETLDKQNVALQIPGNLVNVSVPFTFENLVKASKVEGKHPFEKISLDEIHFSENGLAIIASIPTNQLSMLNSGLDLKSRRENLPGDNFKFQMVFKPGTLRDAANLNIEKNVGKEVAEEISKTLKEQLPKNFNYRMTMADEEGRVRTSEEMNLIKTIILLDNYDLTQTVQKSFNEQIVDAVYPESTDYAGGLVDKSYSFSHVYRNETGKNISRIFKVTNLSKDVVEIETMLYGARSTTKIDIGQKIENSPDQIVIAIDYFLKFVEK